MFLRKFFFSRKRLHLLIKRYGVFVNGKRVKTLMHHVKQYFLVELPYKFFADNSLVNPQFLFFKKMYFFLVY